MSTSLQIPQWPLLPPPPPPSSTPHRCSATALGGGRIRRNKHTQRLLSSLRTVSDDPTAADRLIRKFISSSSKSTSLETLSLLLSYSPSFAISMYRRITETLWFRWNPNLAAAIAALLEKTSLSSESQTLISDSTTRLASNPRNLILFHSALIEAYSVHGLKQNVLDSHAHLKSSFLSCQKTYESTVKALCVLRSPVEAEEVVIEMETRGFRPSAFEYRSVAQAYGKIRDLEAMRRMMQTMERKGIEIDTIGVNVVLSCYGEHEMFDKMLEWIRRTRISNIPLSIRSFNAALNSIPAFSVSSSAPTLSVAIDTVKDASQKLVVKALVEEGGEAVMAEVARWGPEEWKLDLHGCHVGTACLVVLMWAEEARQRVGMGERVAKEVVVVCGGARGGEAPVRDVVRRVMVAMGCPMRVERRNKGRFVGKAETVRVWLVDGMGNRGGWR